MAAAKQRKIDIDLLGLIADSMHCLADDMMAHAESGRDVDERNLEFWGQNLFVDSQGLQEMSNA